MTEKIFRKDAAKFQRLGKVLDKNSYAKNKIIGIIIIVAGIMLCIISFVEISFMTKASKRLWWDSNVNAGIDFFNVMSILEILSGVMMIICGVYTFIVSNNIINYCYTCPNCGGLYWYGDTSCHFCKKVLTDEQSNKNLQFGQSIKKAKICPYCNKELSQDNIFCSGCGKKLP